MIKKICFFSAGFAFNRANRMRSYEKIFPKNTKIFLFTTNKGGFGEKGLKKKWNLKKTKIHVENYNLFSLPFKLRKFCDKNKIQRIANLGSVKAGIFILISSLLKNTGYVLNFNGESLIKYKLEKKNIYKKIKGFFELPLFFIFSKFAKKVTFVGNVSYKKSPIFLLKSPRKITFSHPPINTDIFYPKNKKLCRKKLGFKQNKKIILYVGRINWGKASSEILKQVILENKNIHFILIGKWIESEISKFEAKNMTHIEEVLPRNLVNYYCASDLVYFLHKCGDQMGFVGEEALACGVPVIEPDSLKIWSSSAILKAKISVRDVNNKIKKFFSLSKKRKRKLSMEARRYAQNKFSIKTWKKDYINFYLK